MSIRSIRSIRDLTDPAAGPHAVQLIVEALTAGWDVPVVLHRGDPVVSVRDHYDLLRYPPDAVTRDRRYSRYVDDDHLLRAHTTAHIPALLRDLPRDLPHDDVLLAVPGLCYRRDVIDRNHVGEPHQLDLWRIRLAPPPLDEGDLAGMISRVVGAVLPGRAVTTPASPHPYTVDGRELYVDGVEIGECGVAHPEVLAAAGLPAPATGLAMGLGLDRLAMLVKGIDDIRLLRSPTPGWRRRWRTSARTARSPRCHPSGATCHWRWTPTSTPNCWATACATCSAPGPGAWRSWRCSARPRMPTYRRWRASASASGRARRTSWCGW